MALKKSELYSSLWQSCDELRGGMDASQYKDYVLVLLFIKYVSDKYASVPFAPITIPEGASFKDMVALKGKSDIGDQINKKIIAPLANANKLSDFPDFNDANKLGSGKEMVDRLTNLIAIFENPALDFSKNRADNDDILGDAYEYLMRHFATESGKSKGQFYTPAEVSRVIAQILGIRKAKTGPDTTVYDPTCGSGSLLLKVADEASTPVTLYGQEKDATTSGLARMNMILHNNPTALIVQGNTLADPKFKDGDTLKTFDYVVANPPFSDKRWSTGLDPLKDPFERFKPFGVPPAKQGDYAYLLQIVRSLKSTGKGECILPHGVLFRGNAEAGIRQSLVRKGYIAGIIGLPANIFYGTGIPACIVVIDKQDAHTREGIFMIDASQGFMKDGPKNRLRAQDIHKIVDTFTKQLDISGYSRLVSFEEIEKNEFNLNLPRYIDSQQAEDVQDIEGHLRGGIPAADVEALQTYWAVCPNLKTALFKETRPGYFALTVDKEAIKPTIFEHQEFVAFTTGMNAHFNEWRRRSADTLKALQPGFPPKEVISALSKDLLSHYANKPLIDKYDVYQHLMDYWADTMQDDCYLISAVGWKAETYRIIEKNKKGNEKDKGWTCDLVPKIHIVARYFAKEQATIDHLAAELESATARMTELEEEYGGEDGALGSVNNKTDAIAAWNDELKTVWDQLMPETFVMYCQAIAIRDLETDRLAQLERDHRILELRNDKGNITIKNINQRLKATTNADEQQLLQNYIASKRSLKEVVKSINDLLEKETGIIIERLAKETDKAELAELAELKIINIYLELTNEVADLKASIKSAEAELDAKAYAHYPKLTEDEVKVLVVDDKWLAALDAAIHGEMDRISQALTGRIKQLAERYDTPLPELTDDVEILSGKVDEHLKKMGFAWS